MRLPRTSLRAALPASRCHHAPSSTRSFSSTSLRFAYEDTVQNLKIGKHTRVMYQGFTGKVSTVNAKQSIAWGTNIVGGCTPGKEGEHIGLPLLPTVRKAAEQLKPDATAVFVGAQHAASAIEEAIEAEIPLIVAVAEFIPLHDILRISQMLNTQSKSRFVGANAPGIISPLGECRIGFQPLLCYMPGHIGMVAKSGTLSYEAVGSLTRAKLGQSVCIGMGGDIVAGTNLVDSLKMFENDPDTEAIVLIGEVGGRAELDAAEWIKDYRRRVSDPKPIAGLVGGLQAQKGRIMGHAGAFASLGEVSAEVKAKALADAGVTMVSHPSQFGKVMKEILAKSGRDVDKILESSQKAQAAATGRYSTEGQSSIAGQVRSFHTTTRRSYHTSSRPRPQSSFQSSPTKQQRRMLHLSDKQSKDLLRSLNIPVSENKSSASDPEHRFLAITVDRTNRCPAIIASPTTDPNQITARSKLFPYEYNAGPNKATIEAAMQHLQVEVASPKAMAGAVKLVQTLVDLFKSKEAYALTTHLSPTEDGGLEVDHALFSFDDSAYKVAKRNEDIHSQRNLEIMDQDEYSVEKYGIVYVKLDNPDASIATLINGAGLAMNADDVLTQLGAYPTNFLDTGGKATSETVKKSFEVILKDSRVKVIFVNIFGGLTLCDMIAEGIMLAFKDLQMKIPVVVRLRGTNEAEGQKMIAESGLPLHAYDDFFEAAEKCKELAAQAS